MTKYRHFCIFLSKNISKQLISTKKFEISKKIFSDFWAPTAPLGVPHISASRTLIKKPLGKSSNLAQLGLHAKFQPNRTIRLARARGGFEIPICKIALQKILNEVKIHNPTNTSL